MFISGKVVWPDRFHFKSEFLGSGILNNNVKFNQYKLCTCAPRNLSHNTSPRMIQLCTADGVSLQHSRAHAYEVDPWDDGDVWNLGHKSNLESADISIIVPRVNCPSLFLSPMINYLLNNGFISGYAKIIHCQWHFVQLVCQMLDILLLFPNSAIHQ